MTALCWNVLSQKKCGHKKCAFSIVSAFWCVVIFRVFSWNIDELPLEFLDLGR